MSTNFYRSRTFVDTSMGRWMDKHLWTCGLLGRVFTEDDALTHIPLPKAQTATEQCLL